MSLITPEYRELQRKLHATGTYGLGGSIQDSLNALAQAGAEPGKHSVLDYGCGNGQLKKAIEEQFDVREYDPCIDGKDGPPEKADFVLCNDVLEHIEPDCLPHVLGHIKELARLYAILIISTRKANKDLEDGRNAHLIVEGLDWWKDRLSPFFRIQAHAEARDRVIFLCEAEKPMTKFKSIGVMSDDERNEFVKQNVGKTWKRIPDTPVPLFGRKPGAPSKATKASGELVDLPEHVMNRPSPEFQEYYLPTVAPDGTLVGDRWLIICGYGPSIADTWDQIKPQKEALNAKVVSVSGAHDFLKRKGIFPDYHVECDPRLHKSDMIKKPLRKTKYLMASCCHPDFLKRFDKADMTLWHLFNGEASYKIRDIPSEKTAAMIPGGGNVLLRSLVLFYYLGYRNFVIHGFDCSYREEDGKETTHAGKHSQTKIAKAQPVRVEGSDRWFRASPVLISYALHMEKDILEGRYPGCQFHFMGDGLFQEMLKVYKKKVETQPGKPGPGYGRDYFQPVPSDEGYAEPPKENAA
jgi:hypothetical protein